ncbi:hypothetical protein D9M72_265840 [compost metagenome]
MSAAFISHFVNHGPVSGAGGGRSPWSGRTCQSGSLGWTEERISEGASPAADDALRWLPLGIDSDDEVAEYAALHDGVPEWLVTTLREHYDVNSGEAVLNMMRLLWNGQHDRHGGQPSAPGDVTFEEAQVVVSLAVNIVQLFSAGLVQRR